MKTTATTIGIAVVGTIALAGCGGGSGNAAAITAASKPTSRASTTASPKASSTTTSLAALTASFHPPAQVGAARWAIKTGDYVAASDHVIVMEGDANSSAGANPHLTGLHAADGTKAWSLDLTQPPAHTLTGPGTNNQPGSLPNLSFYQIGSSVAAEWKGSTPASGLKSAVPAHLFAVYSIDTGKQLGSTVSINDGTDTSNGGVLISGNAVDMHPGPSTGAVGAGDPVLYADGSSTTSLKVPNTSNPFGGIPVPLGPKSLVMVDRTNTGFNFQAATPGGAHLKGSPTLCKTIAPSGGATKFITSPNGVWSAWGLTLLNTATPGELRCLWDMSPSPAVPVVVGDDGSVYANVQVAGSGSPVPAFLSATSNKFQALPANTTLPTAVLPTGAVFAGNGVTAFYAK